MMAARKQVAIVPHAENVTSEFFADLDTYKALEVKDQDRVVALTNSLYAAAAKTFASHIEAGQVLKQLRGIYKVNRGWEQYMNRVGVNRATANRKILLAERVANYPPVFVNALMRIDKPIDPKRLKAVVVPTNPTEETARELATIVADKRGYPLDPHTHTFVERAEIIAPNKSTEEKVGQAAQKIRAIYQTIHGDKAKQKFITEVCSIALGMLGVGNPQTIAPQAFPAKYLPAPVGRPRLVKE